MGMFDDVRCEVALPDGWEPVGLQSKDFDCVMTMVLIRADGRLLIEDREWEEVPREERPYPDAEPGTLESIIGIMRTVNRRWRDLDFHGVFNFYGSEGRHGSPGYRRHVYNAKFTDGRLVDIDAMPHPGREMKGGL